MGTFGSEWSWPNQWGQVAQKPAMGKPKLYKPELSILQRPWFKPVCIALTIGVLSEIAYYCYKKWRKRSQGISSAKSESKEVEEVLFFPDAQIACKDHFVGEDGCSRQNCRFTHEHNSLSRLYQFLDEAIVSLDVCVFVICCADLGDLLITAHKRKVKVRVICDDEQIDITGSQIWKLRKAGNFKAVVYTRPYNTINVQVRRRSFSTILVYLKLDLFLLLFVNIFKIFHIFYKYSGVKYCWCIKPLI